MADMSTMNITAIMAIMDRTGVMSITAITAIMDGPADRNVVLLRYMYDHNMHHAEELVELAAALRAEGREKAAGLIDEALNAYRSGNELLSKALSECGEV